MKFKKIVIVGLGLMGGSLAAACRKAFPETLISGVTRNRRALARALRERWIDEGTGNVAFGASEADLIVLCTPVDVYLPILKEIDRVCGPGALVMDVGSVKGSVHALVNAKKWRRISFVGAHPMVGSHKRGIEAGCPALYREGTVILTKDRKTCPGSFRKALRFWEKLVKKTVVLDPLTHDALVSEISHLPHAMAVCLVHAVSAKALPLAAGGFRDTTRIAASDTSIWLPIFEANRRQVLRGVKKLERELEWFRRILRTSDTNRLRRYLDQAQKIRKSL
jgi:prephenate dehydrogenase